MGGGHFSTLVLTWIEVWTSKENERKSYWIELLNKKDSSSTELMAEKVWRKISAVMTCIQKKYFWFWLFPVFILVGAVLPLEFLGNKDLHTVLIFTGNVDLLTLHVKLEAGRELKFPILLGPEVNKSNFSKLRIHM